MAKIRVYELAKQLNMTNKALLEKLAEMKIAVKSHMSVLDEEEVSGIREAVFHAKKEEVVEKRIKSTIIRRRKKVIVKEPEVPDVTPVAKVVEEEIRVEPQEEAAPPEIKAGQIPVAAPGDIPAEKITVTVEEPESAMGEPKVAAEPSPTPSPAEKEKPAEKVRPKKKVRSKREQPAKIIKMPDVKAIREAGSREDQAVPVPAEEETLPHLKLVVEKEKPAAAPKPKKKKDKKRLLEEEAEKPLFKKKIGFRKKEILDRADLYDDKGVGARKDRRHRKGKVALKGEKPLITTPKAIKRRIKVDEAIAVSELAKRMGVKAGEVIKKLMTLGVIAALNQAIDFETATVVAGEFEYETEKVSFEEKDVISRPC